MGYDITARQLPRIKKEHIETVRKLIEKDEPIPLNWSLDDTGHWDDCWNAFRACTDDIAVVLAPYAEAGDMEFIGEDDDQWGFQFDGKGRVFHIEYTAKRGKEMSCIMEMKGKKIAM